MPALRLGDRSGFEFTLDAEAASPARLSVAERRRGLEQRADAPTPSPRRSTAADDAPLLLASEPVRHAGVQEPRRESVHIDARAAHLARPVATRIRF
jgi:hypothetical protein